MTGLPDLGSFVEATAGSLIRTATGFYCRDIYSKETCCAQLQCHIHVVTAAPRNQRLARGQGQSFSTGLDHLKIRSKPSVAPSGVDVWYAHAPYVRTCVEVHWEPIVQFCHRKDFYVWIRVALEVQISSIWTNYCS